MTTATEPTRVQLDREAEALRFAEFSRRKHFGSLDGLRAISILGVVWYHAARGRPFPLAEEGAHGVPLFFAISGFLITTLLLRERDRNGDISMKSFYARRSLRIFPLYYTVLAVYVVLVACFDHGETGTEFMHNLKYFLTYTSNWFVHGEGHSRVIFVFAWSLATEEQFYLVWPNLERVLGRASTHLPAAIALLVALLESLVRFGVIPLDHESLFARIILSIAPAICFGVVLAHILYDERGFGFASRLLGRWWLSPALLVATVLLLRQPGPGWSLASYATMTLLVGACVVKEDHGLAWLLKSRPFRSIGQVSYGIYLMHMLAVNFVERGLGKLGVTTHFIVFPLEFLTAWGVATVSFHKYEARFLALKERFVR